MELLSKTIVQGFEPINHYSLIQLTRRKIKLTTTLSEGDEEHWSKNCAYWKKSFVNYC